MDVPFSRLQCLTSVVGPVSDGTRSVEEASGSNMVQWQFSVVLFLFCGSLSDLRCVRADSEPDPARRSPSDPEGPLPLSGVIRDDCTLLACRESNTVQL